MDSIYDRTLYEIGNESKYQKRFEITYLVIFIGFWGMTYMNMILSLAITPHMCKIPEKPGNISEMDWKIINIPRYEDIITKQTKFENCLVYAEPYKNNKTMACQEYTFDTTWYDTTVPSDYNWVCDKELNVANILAYSKVGDIIGSIFFGWFSDVYGRRYTYIISVAMLLFGRLISLVAGNSYIFFSVGCFIANLPSWSAPQNVTSISIEMSSTRRRSLIASMRFTAYSTGLFVMGLLFWWIRDWRIFTIVTTAPLIPFLIMSWTMIESPRWLYTQGRLQESLTQLKKIAKVNKKKIEDSTEKELLSANFNESPQIFGVMMLFSSKQLTINTILQAIIWIVASLSYVLLVMRSGEKTDGNPFLDFAWQSLIEVPAVYLAAWLADKIGRRYTGIVSIGVTAAMWTTLAIRENSAGGWIRKWWMGTLLNILARLATTVIFFIINLLNMELYPTCIRQTGTALGNIVAGTTSVVVPYVLYLGRRIDSRLPGIIVSLTCLLGILASYLLPETLKAKLPETLEEAQTFGRKNKSIDSRQLQPLKTP
ncbi:solute carrier family 22 member 7 [Vanessa atalanta]|uniref:solute carrier family 22 member 7 n=1 Tax=Vanessa atalanta TaxID=42275 RepID=UPI001FCCC5E6|nr:solute carrier family 22 member 7 [Vanessa atalanta]